MHELTRTEIRQIFSHSKNFNDIFDAFESAIRQGVDDIEFYRPLFWNDALSTDELLLFGEKLAREYRHIAYDVFMWLANVLEVLFGKKDNYELALTYYQKAAAIKPEETDPYLDACDIYNPDIDVPSIKYLIEFLKIGLEFVHDKKSLNIRLSVLYKLAGDNDLSEYYRLKADEAGESSTL
jgi:hypothetical protein